MQLHFSDSFVIKVEYRCNLYRCSVHALCPRNIKEERVTERSSLSLTMFVSETTRRISVKFGIGGQHLSYRTNLIIVSTNLIGV